MPQDFSNIFSPSFPWPVSQKQAQETSEPERALPYGWFDIHGAEIAEIREKVERLERKGGKEEQEVFPIEFLESEKLTFKKPLTVRSVYCPETETYVVDHFELNIYGEGRDVDEAVKDFKVALEETYFDLKKDKDKLGLSLQKEWELLDTILKEK